MTLRPTDMMEIQSAIDEYEKKYPRRPAPSAETALAWRLGRREAARRAIPTMTTEPAPKRDSDAASEMVQQECGRFTWAWEQMRLQVNMWRGGDFLGDAMQSADSIPWVQGALRVGWWGLVAAISVTVFVFGAILGGLK